MRERVLVTGASGFVGRHLLEELGERALGSHVDVTDGAALSEAVRSAAPDAVVHLAAATSVASSWALAATVWHVNVVGTVNVLDAVSSAAPHARVVVASSGEVYGDTGETAATEDAPLAPVSPYAASKAAAEVACERARRVEGLDIVVARPFPHVGPGQDERFAVGSWVRQIARLEREGGGTIDVGDVDVWRDVSDVRDVARAYRLLADGAAPAGVYNIASGRAVSLREILAGLIGLARVPVAIGRDPARLRPADVRRLRGDAMLLGAATGWRPEIPLEQTLADALDAARETVATGQTTPA